ATIYTVDPSLPIANTLVYTNDKILGTYDKAESISSIAKRWAVTKVVNGHGQFIIPGLIDAHGHLMELGLSLVNCDLMGTKSVEEMKSRLIRYVQTSDNFDPQKDWLVGSGWDQNHFSPPIFPTLRDLRDPLLDSIPILLYRIDIHAILVNSAVLSKLDPSLLKPVPGGEIIRDDKGDLTGLFIDNAMNIVEAIKPSPSKERLMLALKSATNEMHRNGLVGLHDAGVLPHDLEFYKYAADTDNFPLRSYAMISCPSAAYPTLRAESPLFCASQFNNGAPLLNYKNKLTVRSVKLFLDGALGSWGAKMANDYSDSPGKTGFLRCNDTEECGELADVVDKWTNKGYQVNVHCIGDKANTVALNAFESLTRTQTKSLGSLRPRIEHAQIVQESDIRRFGKLQVIPSMQPTHCTSDMHYAESRLGKERINGAYAWKSMLKAGVPALPLSSDFPVEKVNPFEGIYAAVTRNWKNGTSPHGPNGWIPSQKLSRLETIKGFTIDAAFAAFQENITGSLTPNKYPDFIIIDRDIMNIPANDILKIKVLSTVIGGKCVYGGENLGEELCNELGR
ncbi:amidohydrolase 3, partial [Paraphysoderma sedebokerense]